jgi:hypothetical protein
MNESKYQGIERASFGMRILKLQGWEEGTGLGPRQDGLKRHLHASKREHLAGLGTDRRDNTGVSGADWTRNAKNFESVLKGLKEHKSKLSSINVDDEEEDAREKKRAKKKTSKKERKERKERKEKKTTTTKGSTSCESGEEKDVPERPRSAVGHAGRYHKREREKLRDYSFEDMNAILGGGAFGTLHEVRANNNDTDSDNDNDKNDDDDDDDDDDARKVENKKSSSKKREKKKSKKDNISAREESPTDELVPTTTQFKFPPKSKDWWGHAFGFCQEGFIKDTEEDNATTTMTTTKFNKNKLGFTEEEQMKLFEEAHLNATTKSSHRGLGLSSSGKEAGHEFEGTKLSLDDVIAEDDDDEKKAKVKAWSKLAQKILKKENDNKLDAEKFWQKLMKKALDGEKLEQSQMSVWDDAMRWTIRRDGKFVVGYDFIALCK